MQSKYGKADQLTKIIIVCGLAIMVPVVIAVLIYFDISAQCDRWSLVLDHAAPFGSTGGAYDACMHKNWQISLPAIPDPIKITTP